MAWCVSCNQDLATVPRLHAVLCTFCMSCLRHELKIGLDNMTGPRYLATFYTGEHTLGYGLYLARTPRAAMIECARLERRNGWLLIRLDVQRTLKDIFVSPEFQKYMPHSQKAALAYDTEQYGNLVEQAT